MHIYLKYVRWPAEVGSVAGEAQRADDSPGRGNMADQWTAAGVVVGLMVIVLAAVSAQSTGTLSLNKPWFWDGYVSSQAF